MSTGHRRLRSPLEIGGVSLRNRVVVTAHVPNFGNDQHLATARTAAYLRERARGGVGLIVSESLAVHPTAGPNTFFLQLWDDEAVEPLRQVTSGVKAEGAVIFAQLNHGGREHNSLQTRRPLVAPSALPSPKRPEVPHALTVDEIDELVAAFAGAADRAARAGFQGIEVHGGHGYLIQQFLSPWSNVRTDAYGGDLAGRMRFMTDVLGAVRTAMPAGMPLGLRISADEFAPAGGLDVSAMQEVVARVRDLGVLDYLSVSQGSYAAPGTFIPDASFGRTPFTHLTRAIKAVVPDLPVVGVGSIVTPDDAERILAEGTADLVGMTRAHIADPHLVRKVEEDRVEDLRQCILCNACFDRLMSGVAITCLQNPRVGREQEWPEDDRVPPAGSPRTVVVVGGGPAGLEAAVVAAGRGHAVTLLEAEPDIGGAVRRYAGTPSRREFPAVIEYRRRKLAEYGVDVRTGVRATAEDVLALAPDCVVVACGAEASSGSLPFGAAPAMAAIDGSVTPGRRVAVLDGDGYAHAAVTAEILLDRGHEVSLVTPSFVPHRDVTALASRAAAAASAGSLRTFLGAVPLDRAAGRLRLRDAAGNEVEVEVDTLVSTGHLVARDGLVGQLHGKVDRVVVAGDAAAPRQASEAIADAHRLAWEI